MSKYVLRTSYTRKAHVQLWLRLRTLTTKIYLFLLKSVVRELISRYWSRRRRQKNPSESVSPDQVAAIRAVKDEVADMLSEIRNILKTNKRSRSRERILRSEEIAIEVNGSPWNYQAVLFCFILFYHTNGSLKNKSIKKYFTVPFISTFTSCYRKYS